MLNDTKPYGNILDFRGQESAVDAAITLFSGEAAQKPKDIWLVDAAPLVIARLDEAMRRLRLFMESEGVACAPAEANNLKGDAARSVFINRFKEVQRLHTQLEGYTDLTPQEQQQIETTLPPDDLQAWRGVYLETAQRLKAKQDKQKDRAAAEVQALDFEFVLFASAIIDYDYIMGLLARYSQQKPGGKRSLTREQLTDLIRSDAKLMDESGDITAYIATLQAGAGLSEASIRAGYEAFKAEKQRRALAELAARHGLDAAELQALVQTALQRLIFDGESLSELLAPLGLGWKVRAQKEQELMNELIPLLRGRADGREISGLSAYEQ